ncbi:hypothetical protein [Methylobacterium brachiatum]
MLDATQIVEAIQAGAAVAAGTSIETVTKLAYEDVKNWLTDTFGGKAKAATAKLEAAPNSEEAQRDLARVLSTLTADDAQQLAPLLENFFSALKRDPASGPALSAAQVRFDLEAERDLSIEEIVDAQSLEMRGRAGQDITIGSVRMAKPDNNSGNR